MVGNKKCRHFFDGECRADFECDYQHTEEGPDIEREGTMLFISIDGACKRNGKPDCIAAGAAFISYLDDDGVICNTSYIARFEFKSTNQRGELLALIDALDYAYSKDESVMLLTDSEYLFNGIYNKWFKGWESRSWKTVSGDAVKNRDLWEKVAFLVNGLEQNNKEVIIYHIKGHCIPFGKVTANNLIDIDSSGLSLYNAIAKKYEEIKFMKKDNLYAAKELSVKNNKFDLDKKTLKRFVVHNIVADALATRCVEKANALLNN